MRADERIGKWIERYEENGYINGSILIASNKDIILNKGFGMANWEHSVSNKPTTKFRIGSLTKAFTSMGIYQLHEKGKLCIDDCIGKYLPDYPLGENITLYHCLTSTTGIPNYTSFPDFWSKTMRLPMTLEQLIDSFKHLELNFEPGMKFEYSSSGYTLLTAIIEKVSGMSYAEYIKEKICRPLGMSNTGCDDGIEIVADLASGYSFWEKPIHSAYADLSFPLGAYGLYSTTEDLFLWDQALESSQLLNKELMEKMFSPNISSYASGWMVSEMLGRKCVHHFGDISGFCSNFLRFVDEQVTVIFLSNINVTPVTHLTQEMARVLFDEQVSLPLSTQPINFTNTELIAGKYLIENDESKILDITLKNGELYLTVPKMYGVLYKFKLIPVSHNPTKTTFLTEMVNEQLIFHYCSLGKIESVEYKDFNGNKYIAYKDL
ncbi:class A beta-lactamase-related serine hydrolase [Oceanobacillus piezotolerans]|uniref:Class A beta-lactamase-related serine hydrolase n=1 Tax=Oceanobacillus piezotolerans TaxID=2448030 RepID=A0A498DEE8_9BACI|nr:serine hydrolase domain-containing protein [Oceanobacillus piezotolerans]RLL48456.1 class A beta-lactamase-related serine hydrolase [Oceanobacillus piezotolerans]